MKIDIPLSCQEMKYDDYSRHHVPCRDLVKIWFYASGVGALRGFCKPHVPKKLPKTWVRMSRTELEVWLIMVS